MNLVAIISNFRFQDVLDVLFLTAVAYHLYLWFRGTKAFKALVGLLVLGIVFTAARTWGLFLTTWVFQILWQVLILLLIILFQSEIRQVLERVNPLKGIGHHKQPISGTWIADFVSSVFSLAKRKIGSLIIIERLDQIEEWITGSQTLEGEPSPELLISIFQKESPLHDGAVLVRDGRITRVSCYLPLSSSEDLPPAWGTRHRAALGLTERCDAIVVIVSEERGDVALARHGRIVQADTPERLSQRIDETLAPISQAQRGWKEKVRSLVMKRWHTKLGTLVLVFVLWLLLAGQQDFERTFSVPLEMTSLPSSLQVREPVDPKIQLKVRGLRKDASTLSERNVRVSVDLSLAESGKRSFPITRDQIQLPNERIYVIAIEPAQVMFQFE